MNFEWTTQQQDLKDTAVKFARTKLLQDPARQESVGRFSAADWQACADFGITGAILPKKYGGLALDPLTVAAVLEGLGRGGADNGLLFSLQAQLWSCILPLSLFGSNKQKQNYLAKLAQGKVIGANAMTEPDSGSDVFSMQTVYRTEKKYFLLNGSKTFVTNAPVADVFLVYARDAAKKDNLTGISCFLVEKNTPGLKIGRPIEKMGLQTSPLAEVFFTDCKIPWENILGRSGDGSLIFNTAMEWERIFILANALGRMEKQLADCWQHVQLRRSGRTILSKQQAVTNRLAEMKLRLESSRWLLYRAAELKSNNKPAILEGALAKLQVSEAYIQNCREALQLFGAYGYTKEYGLEKELRDALASAIYSGTSDIQKNIISGLMLY